LIRQKKAYILDIRNHFDEMEGREVSIAGRMMAKREMGKASFIDIQDKQGRIQCHVKKDILGDGNIELTNNLYDLDGNLIEVGTPV